MKAKAQKSSEGQGIRDSKNHINDLPEELLLKVATPLPDPSTRTRPSVGSGFPQFRGALATWGD